MNTADLPLLTGQSTDVSFSDWLIAARESGAAALIDKQTGWTSFDVVAKLRSLTRIRKIGHAGTLDPLATGLLIVCLGRATKRIEEFQKLDKHYSATIKLGATTPTDDAEMPEEHLKDTAGISEHDIATAAQHFSGLIEQIPPTFSAIKSAGRPFYKAARRGEAVAPPSRTVQIYSITVKKVSLPVVEIEVHCGKGTYIRSLARDIGAALGCGGYLASLRRAAIGDYTVENAVTIDIIKEYAGRYAESQQHEHIITDGNT